MTEWHVTPEFINRNWTEEMMVLLFRSRARRFRRQSKKSKTSDAPMPSRIHRVSDTELFDMMGIKVEQVQRRT